jgi:8-amino-7-oxononanoate synthase
MARLGTIDRIAADLVALRAADQFRDLSTRTGIELGSNDYLGLSSHPRLRRAIALAVQEDARVASTGSRLLSGNSYRWEQLETEFAKFVGAEASLYFPSGYAANVGLLSAILRPVDTVFSDNSNHASLIDGIRLSGARKVIFPHLDLGYLEEALRREDGPGEKIIVVESVFSMDGDHSLLPELISLCEQYDAGLIVDEAHTIGVEGEQGSGVTKSLGVAGCMLARVFPCGKALVSMGAFVAGTQTLKDFLINRARTFMFTTALPPYCAAHIREAVKLVADADVERRRLTELGRHLRKRLQVAGFDIGRSDSQIIPLLLGSNEAALGVAAAMNSAHFAVRAIRPPTVPEGASRLRLSLNATLSIPEMDRLVEALVATRESKALPQ